jgi:hypothetical protein
MTIQERRDAHKMETVHLIGFFFSLFPPPRSIRWTVFLIVDRDNFHEVISLFSDRSDLCVCLCVCACIL